MGRVLLGLAVALLAGCGLVRLGPDYTRPESPAAAAWRAPLPHGGDVAALAQWWQAFDDPLLVRLIEAAQTESPDLARAQARIEQARAQVSTTRAAARPLVDGSASVVRTQNAGLVEDPPYTQRSSQLQASWELDLFGGRAREQEAARARLGARRAGWHEARVSVAAEVAGQYLQYRHCEALTRLLRTDLASRRESLRLAELGARTGLQAQSNVVLARAGLADALGRLSSQQLDCQLLLKGLVSLSGLSEAALEDDLRPGAGRIPAAKRFALREVPAAVLSQRPDVAVAEREVAAASAEIGVAEAARYPQLSLSGLISPIQVSVAGYRFNANNWSIGPSLSLPVLDSGRRAASADAARASYRAAAAEYRARARQAVREVEEALLRLATLDARRPTLNAAAQGYRQALRNAAEMLRLGLGTQLDLEETRRLAITAEQTLIALERDQALAWIALYRAVGGDWSGG